jgi:4-hydroxy-3-methylbut-2-enyl diphosphate reductase
VERALTLYGAPVYVRHEIVHNRYVVDSLRAKGAIFVESLDEVPSGATVIFSAHGVSKAVQAKAAGRGLKVFDATCPLVTKVHMEVAKMLKAGLEIVMIGHRGHPEAEGTMGQAEHGMYLVETMDDVAALEVADPEKLAYVTQTTLSVDDTREVIDALKRKFPAIVGPDTKDICYATQNRQRAVRELAEQVDMILVIGAPNSSNSNRLREIAEELGVPSHLIENAGQLDPKWLEGLGSVGVTAGASAPDVLVQEVVAKLQQLNQVQLSFMEGIAENVKFRLPPQLEAQAQPQAAK